MNRNESRNAVEVDDLEWDTTEAPDQDNELAKAARLAPYSYASEHRTLVGIGPLGRARRSHPGAAAEPAAAPQSERMPLSEPPGPFIADDEDEVPPFVPRGRALGKRAVAISLVLLVPLAVVGLLRRPSHSGDVPRESARAAAMKPVPSAELASASNSLAVAVAERDEDTRQAAPETQTSEVAATTETDGAPPASRNGNGEQARTAAASERATHEPVLPRVKLAEVPAMPAVVDRSNGDSNAGTINLVSTPPSSVVLDGRPIGKSPSVVRASAGAHTLVFIHPLYGRRSLRISVRPGVTTTASTDF